MNLAEAICGEFAQLDLKKKNTGESLGKVTLSFGVSRYRSGEDMESFLSRADQALSQSKKLAAATGSPGFERRISPAAGFPLTPE